METAWGCDPPQVLRSRSARAPARCSQGGRFPKKNASSSRASKPSRLACKALRCDPPAARARAFARVGACVLEFGINWPERYHIVHFSKPKCGTNFCAKIVAPVSAANHHAAIIVRRNRSPPTTSRHRPRPGCPCFEALGRSQSRWTCTGWAAASCALAPGVVATPSSTREEVLELEIQHGEKVNAMGQQIKWA
jgi:hypothetical protein